LTTFQGSQRQIPSVVHVWPVSHAPHEPSHPSSPHVFAAQSGWHALVVEPPVELVAAAPPVPVVVPVVSPAGV
jgi:hypothetical protein